MTFHFNMSCLLYVSLYLSPCIHISFCVFIATLFLSFPIILFEHRDKTHLNITVQPYDKSGLTVDIFNFTGL